jgi:hypothetical protein
MKVTAKVTTMGGQIRSTSVFNNKVQVMSYKDLEKILGAIADAFQRVEDRLVHLEDRVKQLESEPRLSLQRKLRMQGRVL